MLRGDDYATPQMGDELKLSKLRELADAPAFKRLSHRQKLGLAELVADADLPSWRLKAILDLLANRDEEPKP